MRRAAMLAAALLCSGPATAADDAALAQCAAIGDASARLACYDTLAGRPAATDAGAAQVPGDAPAAVPGPGPAPPAAAGAGAVDANFGLPPTQAPAPDSIAARVAGSLNHLKRGQILTLDNGQAWKLVGDDDAYYTNIPDNAEVFITKGFLGTFWLEIRAINRRFKVKRVN